MDWGSLTQLLQHHLHLNDVCEFLLIRYIPDFLDWNSLPNHFQKTIENLHLKCDLTNRHVTIEYGFFLLTITEYTLFSKYHTRQEHPIIITIISDPFQKPPPSHETPIEYKLTIQLWYKKDIVHRGNNQPAIIIQSLGFSKYSKGSIVLWLLYKYPIPKRLANCITNIKKAWCVNGLLNRII